MGRWPYGEFPSDLRMGREIMKRKTIFTFALLLTSLAVVASVMSSSAYLCHAWEGKYVLQKEHHFYALDLLPNGIATLSVDGVKTSIAWEKDDASNNIFLNGEIRLFQGLRNDPIRDDAKSKSTSFGLGRGCLIFDKRRLYVDSDLEIYFSAVE